MPSSLVDASGWSLVGTQIRARVHPHHSVSLVSDVCFCKTSGILSILSATATGSFRLSTSRDIEAILALQSQVLIYPSILYLNRYSRLWGCWIWMETLFSRWTGSAILAILRRQYTLYPLECINALPNCMKVPFLWCQEIYNHVTYSMISITLYTHVYTHSSFQIFKIYVRTCK